MRWRVIVSLCLGLVSACGRSTNRSTPAGPCVWDRDCPAGYRCIDSECVLLPDGGEPDVLVLKEFGEPCERNEECRSTYCLGHPLGSFCTKPCSEGCPEGWECARVPDPHGGDGTVDLCAVLENYLCRSCADDEDCGASGANRCLGTPEGRFCGRDCTFGACPEGYDCRQMAVRGEVVKQCVPSVGTCVCDERTDGMARGCQRENAHGVCQGFEICHAGSGWGECNASEPAPEDCNGLDDDCDGFLDEDLDETQVCSKTNEYGTCVGRRVCSGSAGWTCDASEPAAEACDGVDNDCDGETDEGFVDAQGRYVTKENCGACGVDCDEQVPHARATECRIVDGEPVCRATACEDGYFVYQDGLTCLALPQNLCAPCATDEDCLAPNSLCVELGTERFCARDCAPDSVYGPTCPPGYSCEAYGILLQCLPVTGTCQCRPDTLGAVRSCQVDTCQGYQTCELRGGLYEWSECDIEDYNEEICDGLDNDCDGVIDEGFLNPATGRYESDEHCGFCNNDCSKYWSEPIHHTTGVCDTTLPVPECRMGPCSTEQVGGTTYEWVDVNGSPDDGCECRRVLGNTDQDDPDLIEYPAAGHEYVDENCDGVDGVVAHALFVWQGYDGSNGPPDGSRTRPYRSISEAVAAFPGSGKRYILVAEGTYRENVVLVPGVQLHGGYSADFAQRDVAYYPTIIQAAPTGGTLHAAVEAVGIRAGPLTLVSGFVLKGRDVNAATAPGEDGQPSYAVYLRDCDQSVVIRSNWIVGGTGGAGGRGAAGAAGYGRQDSSELDGGDGTNARRYPGPCVNLLVAGGRAGRNSRCSIANGAPGGSVVCPEFTWSPDPYATPHQGAQAEYGPPAGRNGLGGYDWSFDDMSGSGCAHATESGWPTAIQSRNGRSGTSGANGPHGNGGRGCTGAYGSIVLGRWVASPDRAGTGTNGGPGQGGGGGGAGGGVAYYHRTGMDCPEFEAGPTGGGGGAGGCGGEAGAGGGSGGASVGVFIVQTLPGAPVLLHNWIQRGRGGSGGAGGQGGQGGLGGRGGYGGGSDPASWLSVQAGRGGDGGQGGYGGGGGGGCGGPSFGILGFGLDVSAYASSNEFLLDETVATGGPGGAGGGSAGPGSDGEAGRDGASANLFSFTPCGPGSTCPSGRVCDANQICVPAP